MRVNIRITKDRQDLYNKLMEKYPSLPKTFNSKSIDTLMTLLVEKKVS